LLNGGNAIVGFDVWVRSRAHPEVPTRLTTQMMIDKLRSMRLHATGNMALIFTTAVAGAFVAGNDAGRAFNTFPKMGDDWIPSTEELFALAPAWRNIFESTALVQLDHRVLAMSTLATVIAFYTRGKRLK
jgi:heme A synthase